MGAVQTEEKIAELKEKFISYYKDVPIIKYGAMFIGRDESTVHRWIEKDKNFASRVSSSRAEWVRKKVPKAKAEFALERMEKEIFSQKVEHSIDEDAVDKILKGFGLLNDGKNQKPPQDSSSK